MRNYIFRGKKVYGDGWAYGSLVKCGDYCCILDTETEFKDGDEAFPWMDEVTGVIDGNLTPVQPETVGQYTGLDIENKMIFEGDVICGLFLYALPIKGVCAFRDGSFGLEWKHGDYTQFTAFTSMCNVNYELVGNIHDNPELMEVKG